MLRSFRHLPSKLVVTERGEALAHSLRLFARPIARLLRACKFLPLVVDQALLCVDIALCSLELRADFASFLGALLSLPLPLLALFLGSLVLKSLPLARHGLFAALPIAFAR